MGPGHSNIVDNDLADAAAKAATTLDETPGEITYGSICTFIKSVMKDDPKSHPRSAAVYANISSKKESEIRSRSDQDQDTACGECDAILHDLEHWLCHCPANSHLRQRVFCDTATELGVLTASPTLTITFARVAIQVNTRDAP